MNLIILLVISSMFFHSNCDFVCCVNAFRIRYHVTILIVKVGLCTTLSIDSNNGILGYHSCTLTDCGCWFHKGLRMWILFSCEKSFTHDLIENIIVWEFYYIMRSMRGPGICNYFSCGTCFMIIWYNNFMFLNVYYIMVVVYVFTCFTIF